MFAECQSAWKVGKNVMPCSPSPLRGSLVNRNVSTIQLTNPCILAVSRCTWYRDHYFTAIDEWKCITVPAEKNSCGGTPESGTIDHWIKSPNTTSPQTHPVLFQGSNSIDLHLETHRPASRDGWDGCLVNFQELELSGKLGPWCVPFNELNLLGGWTNPSEKY